MAALEVPFFLTLCGAGSRGLSQTASYVQAFGAVAFWNVLMLLTVVGLLLLPPDKTSAAPQSKPIDALEQSKDGLNDRFAP